MNIRISKLHSNENAPISLLLLADPSEKSIKHYLEQGLCFIAELKNETVGVALIIKTKKSTFEIKNIAIKEEFQNQGIGKQLLLFVIDEVKKMKAKVLEIGTGNSSVIQMLLYQKCGFRITGIDFDYFRRNYSEKIFENGIECRDMIKMQMDLRSPSFSPKTTNISPKK